jgi:formate--tetrahydrofolate ligase
VRVERAASAERHWLAFAAMTDQTLRPIRDVAADLGLLDDHCTPMGRFRCKVALDAIDEAPPGGRARYVLVSAVTPTQAGEGKTVTSIGLTMGLAARGRRAVASLRQSSLGPTFGGKGGGAGGGRSRIEPFDACLLDLGDDLFAVESANNLLAAVVDDHVHRQASPALDPRRVTWRRAVDVDDRALRFVVTGLGGATHGVPRESGFDITAASEVMAVLGLARDRSDLRARLDALVVGFDPDGAPVTAGALGATGAMAVLLRNAIEPNLMQTSNGAPVLVHTGPFANIAHGNSSVVADRLALGRAEYVVTEAGFATELGAEKFFHLKCAQTGEWPDAAVLVTTVRALKSHAPNTSPEVEDVDAVHVGGANLRRHLANLRAFGVPVVVAINRFPSDTPAELAAVRELALADGAHDVVEHEAFARGAAGAVDLAEAVERACATGATPRRLYSLDDPVEEKVRRLATTLYGAAEVRWEAAAQRAMRRFEKAGYGDLPICVAKTHSSLSHDPTLSGAPNGFTFPVRDVRLAAGAGFLTVYAGDILTMPGLPANGRYREIDLQPDGTVTGLR